MANKSAITAITVATICIILIITIPVAIFLVGFSNYGTIDKTLTFYYSPSASPTVETLNLNADVGNIEVQYTTRPTNYHAKVEVHLEISGSSIEGNSWFDFFNVEWQNNSNPIVFSITQKSDIFIDPLSWSIENPTIVVTLRADIVFDIIVTASEGNIEVSVPFAVSVNNIATVSTLGNISLEFKQCVIGGNVNAMNTRDDIFMSFYNVEFSRESNWSVITELGSINLEIEQHKDMGANVIGRAISTDGTIILTYRDTTPNVGARFWTRGDISGEAVGIVFFDGFERFGQYGTDNGYISDDFLTSKNHYDLILETIGDGSILPDLSSFPFD